jgi:branched-chain amino acid transport system substrate-binding protein
MKISGRKSHGFRWLAVVILLLAASCAPKKEPLQPVLAPPETGYQPAAPLKTAEERLNQGQKTEALEVLQNFLEEYPHGRDADHALWKMIQIYESLGEYEYVLAGGNRFMSQYAESPLRFKVLLSMARASAILNLTEQARQQVAEAAATAQTMEEHDEIQTALAFIEQREGRFEEALERLAKLHGEQEEPGRGQTEEKIRELTQAVDTERLERLLPAYSGRFPEELLLWELGRRAMEKNDLDKAEGWFSRLIRDYPSSSAAGAAQEAIEQIQKRRGPRYCEIGCLLPLSGPHEVYGRRILFGLELGFGVYSPTPESASFRLIVRDLQNSPSMAEQQVRELAARENVVAVVGPLLTNPAKAAAREAQRLKLPIITLAQGDKITEIGDYVFRHFITAQMQVTSLVRYALTEQRITNFAVFHPANEYGRIYTALFSEEVRRQGGQITSVSSYEPSQTDFGPAVKRFVEAQKIGSYPAEPAGNAAQPMFSFQAIFIPDDYRAISLIAPQLAYFDVRNVILLGTNLWNSPSLVEKAGTYVQGAVFPDAYCPADQSPEAISFRDGFREVFGEEPDVLAALAFDTAGMLKEAILSTNGATREEIKNALLNLKNYRGVTGLTSFTQTGDAEKNLFLLTVQGESIVPLPQSVVPPEPMINPQAD